MPGFHAGSTKPKWESPMSSNLVRRIIETMSEQCGVRETSLPHDIRAGRVRDTVRVEDQIEGIPGLKTGSVVGHRFFTWANGVTALYAGPMVFTVNTLIAGKNQEADSQEISTGRQYKPDKIRLYELDNYMKEKKLDPKDEKVHRQAADTLRTLGKDEWMGEESSGRLSNLPASWPAAACGMSCQAIPSAVTGCCILASQKLRMYSQAFSYLPQNSG